MATLLLDAAHLTERAWYAAQKQHANPEGLLRSYISDIKAALPGAEQITAVFDGPGSGNERRKLYGDYKANCKAMDARLEEFGKKCLPYTLALEFNACNPPVGMRPTT